MGKRKSDDEVQLSPRVPKGFRDQINLDAEVAGCSVGVLIMRMHAAHDPTARRRIERSLGKLGCAINDARLPIKSMQDIHAAMSELTSTIRAMIP
jgi:uncharacterized protein YqkB